MVRTGKAFWGKWRLRCKLQDELESDKGKSFRVRDAVCASAHSALSKVLGSESGDPRGTGEGKGSAHGLDYVAPLFILAFFRCPCIRYQEGVRHCLGHWVGTVSKN